MLHRPVVGAITSVLAALGLVLVPSSCSNDECNFGDAYCDSAGVPFICTRKPEAGLFGQPLVYLRGEGCGRPDLCQVTEGSAFCVLDPTKAPACPAPDGPQCVGEGELDCKGGYATRWLYCANRCDAASGSCPVEPGVSCADGGTCLGTLECHDTLCRPRCGCPNGMPCADCDAYGQMAGYASKECVDGWCAFGQRF